MSRRAQGPDDEGAGRGAPDERTQALDRRDRDADFERDDPYDRSPRDFRDGGYSGRDDDAAQAGDDRGYGDDRERDRSSGTPQRQGYGRGGSEDPQPRAKGNGPAVTSLVLGILALICGLLSFLVVTIFLAVLFGGLAVVFAIAGFRKARNPLVPGRGMAIAGMVTGLLGVAVAILFVIGVASFFRDPANQQQLQQLQDQLQQIEPPTQ